MIRESYRSVRIEKRVSRSNYQYDLDKKCFLGENTSVILSKPQILSKDEIVEATDSSLKKIK